MYDRPTRRRLREVRDHTGATVWAWPNAEPVVAAIVQLVGDQRAMIEVLHMTWCAGADRTNYRAGHPLPNSPTTYRVDVQTLPPAPALAILDQSADHDLRLLELVAAVAGLLNTWTTRVLATVGKYARGWRVGSSR